MVPCACLKSSKYLYQEPRWRGTKLIVANSDMMCSCQLLDPSSTGSSVSFNNSLSVCLRSVEASAWKRIAADWRQMSAHALQREECVYKTHAVFGEPVFMEFSWFGFGFHRWIWIWGKKKFALKTFLSVQRNPLPSQSCLQRKCLSLSLCCKGIKKPPYCGGCWLGMPVIALKSKQIVILTTNVCK